MTDLPETAVLRAWASGHRARSVGGVMVVVAAAVGGFATLEVPTWQEGTPVPLWVLLPGMLAMVSAGLVEDQLSGPQGHEPTRLKVVRALWAVGACGGSMLLAAPTARQVADPDVVWVTGLLAALTFGASVLVGKASALLGAAVSVVGVSTAGSVPSHDKWQWVAEQLTHAGVLAVVAAGVAGLAAYAVVGARARPPGDSPD